MELPRAEKHDYHILSRDPRGLSFTWWGYCVLFQRHKPTELAHSFFFYSVLVSVSVFMAVSAGFHSINSPHNSPLTHSVRPVLSLPYWSFQLYLLLKVSLSPDIILSNCLGWKHRMTNSSAEKNRSFCWDCVLGTTDRTTTWLAPSPLCPWHLVNQTAERLSQNYPGFTRRGRKTL